MCCCAVALPYLLKPAVIVVFRLHPLRKRTAEQARNRLEQLAIFVCLRILERLLPCGLVELILVLLVSAVFPSPRELTSSVYSPHHAKSSAQGLPGSGLKHPRQPRRDSSSSRSSAARFMKL